MEYRVEHDSMGEVRVPADKYWGAQTERSHNNFPIGVGIETMPAEIVHAFGILKKAAARANRALRPEKMTEEKLAAIEQAAIWCGENNRRTFDDIGRKLEQWKKIGAFTLSEIEEERRVQKQYTDICLNVFERCGIDKKVTKTDIGQVRIWTALVELETVLFAAECARGTDAPMKYINKLISSWSAQGIRTLEEAQKASQQHKASFAPAAAKPGQDYAQREVTEDEFENGFYVDLMNRGKAEKA